VQPPVVLLGVLHGGHDVGSVLELVLLDRCDIEHRERGIPMSATDIFNSVHRPAPMTHSDRS
jgi:hypothetical protein